MPTIIGAITHASETVQAIDAYGIPLLAVFLLAGVALALWVDWSTVRRRTRMAVAWPGWPLGVAVGITIANSHGATAFAAALGVTGWIVLGSVALRSRP